MSINPGQIYILQSLAMRQLKISQCRIYINMQKVLKSFTLV